MIAEEDTATRLDDLRHALRTALMKTGVLGAIRAQLRTSAVEILKGSGNAGSDLDLPPHKLPHEGTADHLALMLVYDFLQHFPSLKRSSGIFAEESGLMLQNGLGGKLSFEESVPMAKGLHIENDFNTHSYQKEPMLVTAVRKMMDGTVVSAKRSASPLPRETTDLPAPSPKKSGEEQDRNKNKSQEPHVEKNQPPKPTPLPVEKQQQENIIHDDDATSLISEWTKQANSKSFIEGKTAGLTDGFNSSQFSGKLSCQSLDASKWTKMEKASEDHNGDDWEEIDVVDKNIKMPSKLSDAVSLSVNVVIGSNANSTLATSTRSNASSSTTTTVAIKPAATKTDHVLPAASLNSVVAPLPLFGNLPSLNTHAKSLAPLGNSTSSSSSLPAPRAGTLPSLESSNSGNTNNSSKNISVTIQQQQPAQSSVSQQYIAAPASYEEDFEDDDTF